MKRRLIVLAAMTIARPIGATAPAGALPQLGHEYLNFDGTSRILRKLVYCWAKHKPDVADRALRAPDLQEQSSALAALDDTGRFGSHCLAETSSLKVNNGILLGYLAEEMQAIMPGSSMALGDDRPPANQGLFSWTAVRQTGDAMARTQAVASCLVAFHPQAVQSLLATPETSERERRLFNSMGAAIADCAPANAPIPLHPMVLRSQIAFFYYQATHRDVNGGTAPVAS